MLDNALGPVRQVVAPPDPVHDFFVERMRINLAWCLRLRWAAFAGQLVTIGIVWFLEVELPIGSLLGILGLEVLTNCGLELWCRRESRVKRWIGLERRADALFLGIFLIDFGFLTALLFLTGGPSNPFAIFYLVNMTLAAEVLGSVSVWGLSSVALGLYSLLFLEHRELAALEEPQLRSVGLFVALVTASIITLYLLARLTGELRHREQQLGEERQRAAQREKLEALATLAAGAAHELASPLSTIAVVARDLEVELESEAAPEPLVDDARLVRREVDRCRQILDLMAAGASTDVEEVVVAISVRELFSEVLEGLQSAHRVRAEARGAIEAERFVLPLESICQTLRALLSNALAASGEEASVELIAESTAAELILRVVDRGRGMSQEEAQRATDPFFTTRQPGQGMGLGLFLAKAVAERLGGSLVLHSELGRGTVAELRIPRGATSSGHLPSEPVDRS